MYAMPGEKYSKSVDKAWTQANSGEYNRHSNVDFDFTSKYNNKRSAKNITPQSNPFMLPLISNAMTIIGYYRMDLFAK